LIGSISNNLLQQGLVSCCKRGDGHLETIQPLLPNCHWRPPVMEATILRMTGAASSTIGRTRTHDSSHDRSQSPRNVLRDSEECAIAAATADVSPDWITPKMKGP